MTSATQSHPTHPGLRTAALLLIAGLAIEVVTLGWSHPTAFVLFLGLGALLVAAGVARYLLAMVIGPAEPPPAASAKPAQPVDDEDSP